jgi:hypothetical protein
MILKNLKAIPETNPEDLICLRDGLYAGDLLITAIGCLDFFSWLDKSPADLSAITEKFDIKTRPADVMLTYFASLQLVAQEAGLFRITKKAGEFLTAGSEWSLVPYFSTQTERPVVEKMLAVLKTGEPAGWGAKKNESDWHKAMERDDFADMFTSGMDSRGAYFAPALAKAFDFSKYKSLIDIAGASGIYAACVKDAFPALRTALLEKPPVDRIALSALEKRGMSGKIEVYGGDMFYDPIPGGFDIHLYSHTFHDWDMEENRQLVRKSYQALNKNGMIMIHDAHLNHEKNGPLSVAEYSVLLMFSTRGKCYSLGELEELLMTEGFVEVGYRQTAGNRSIITGKKV